MDNRKLPEERQVAEWLEKGRLDAPPLRFGLSKREPRYQREGRLWDFEIVAAWGIQSAPFAAEYKRLSTPKVFEEALAMCAAAKLPKGRLPMLIMPYLRPEQLKRLEVVGVSGLDCCDLATLDKLVVEAGENPEQVALERIELEDVSLGGAEHLPI